jgi:hypothetical protein
MDQLACAGGVFVLLHDWSEFRDKTKTNFFYFFFHFFGGEGGRVLVGVVGSGVLFCKFVSTHTQYYLCTIVFRVYLLLRVVYIYIHLHMHTNFIELIR